MHGHIGFGRGGHGEIVPVVTAALTIAILVYTVRINRLNEIRVSLASQNNNTLREIRDKIGGKDNE